MTLRVSDILATEGEKMVFLRKIQAGIEFMEEHLFEKISYEDVAKHLNLLKYYFHRNLSIFT